MKRQLTCVVLLCFVYCAVVLMYYSHVLNKVSCYTVLVESCDALHFIVLTYVIFLCMCLCCRELVFEKQTVVLKLVEEKAQKMDQSCSKRNNRRTKRGKYNSYIVLKYLVLTLLMILVHLTRDMTLSKCTICLLLVCNHIC